MNRDDTRPELEALRLLPGRAWAKPRINDDANDGAEQGCDQDIARGFVDLMHGARTMPGMEPAIKSQLNQKARISPLG